MKRHVKDDFRCSLGFQTASAAQRSQWQWWCSPLLLLGGDLNESLYALSSRDNGWVGLPICHLSFSFSSFLFGYCTFSRRHCSARLRLFFYSFTLAVFRYTSASWLTFMSIWADPGTLGSTNTSIEHVRGHIYDSSHQLLFRGYHVFIAAFKMQAPLAQK